MAPLLQLTGDVSWMRSIDNNVSMPAQFVLFETYHQGPSDRAHKSVQVWSVISSPAVNRLVSHIQTRHWQTTSCPASNRRAVLPPSRRCASETAEPAEDHTLSLRRARCSWAVTGGTGDYAIGWKRPSNSPTLSQPKRVWLGGNAHPSPSKSPSIPIQSPSKSRLDGQSAGRDDVGALGDQAGDRPRAESPPRSTALSSSLFMLTGTISEGV